MVLVGEEEGEEGWGERTKGGRGRGGGKGEARQVGRGGEGGKGLVEKGGRRGEREEEAGVKMGKE